MYGPPVQDKDRYRKVFKAHLEGRKKKAPIGTGKGTPDRPKKKPPLALPRLPKRSTFPQMPRQTRIFDYSR